MQIRGADKVKVAIIGAGGMANYVHYPALSSFDEVEIAGVCDIDLGRLHATADRFGIANRFTDYKQMVEQTNPDAVYAIGPPHILYDAWMWLLNRGVNLYIEKPLGITLHQARALAYTAELNNCITQVSFQRRSSPMVKYLKEACLERGPIQHAVCKFYKSEIKPMTGAIDRMMDDCVHSIDTLRWMCDGEVVKVESATKRIQVPDINFISATLYFDNGAMGYLINSWSSGRRIFSVEMHAANICAEAEHEGKGYLYIDGDVQGLEYDARTIAGSDEPYIYGGFLDKHREFIASLKSGIQPSSNFADALKTMEVAAIILAQDIQRN